MKVISLGWGVQSFTLAAMVALKELEPIDYAIHADTTHEASWTYSFVRRWTPWLEERGVKVVTVAAFSSPVILWYSTKAEVSIPAYTIGHGVNGQIRRQCTNDWKIAPMRRWLQSHRNRQPVEMWLGISTDEALRMRESDVKYITNRYPLIDHKMSRDGCENWLTFHGLEVPHKSSCVFCPFHNTEEWRYLRDSGNGDWEKAVKVDNEIRNARPPYDLFVHPARVPLEGIDFRPGWKPGQMSMWDEECSGICGV